MSLQSWRLAERRVLKLFTNLESGSTSPTPGRIVRGSGNGWRKGDVRTKYFIIEVKHTEKDYYRLTVDLLNKIMTESKYENRTPVFAVVLGDGSIRILLPGSIASSVGKASNMTIRADTPKVGDDVGGWTVVSEEDIERIINDQLE